MTPAPFARSGRRTGAPIRQGGRGKFSCPDRFGRRWRCDGQTAATPGRPSTNFFCSGRRRQLWSRLQKLSLVLEPPADALDYKPDKQEKYCRVGQIMRVQRNRRILRIKTKPE